MTTLNISININTTAFEHNTFELANILKSLSDDEIALDIQNNSTHYKRCIFDSFGNFCGYMELI